MITIRDILNECEYDRALVRIYTWNEEGVEELESEGYVEKHDDFWSSVDMLNLDIDIAGYKWKGDLEIDCPILRINKSVHWIEFDPETRRMCKACQIHDGYQAWKIRNKTH